MIRGCIIAAFSLNAFAQLIPSGTPVPRTSKPPVVFINGYQNLCPATSFSNTFGAADQVLKANGEVSLFFSTCSLGPTASIEDLGAAFGDFLANLRYEDGQRVDVVDVVAHSMGGLVLRSYLSGKQNTAGVFRPPAATHVRKAVFLATPHFGTGVALLFGFTTQVQELASGSRFLFDLATWNQGTDDLRGVDAITAVGNGGSGVAVMPGFDDGVVALTAASLAFYMPGRTRVVPFCHVGTGGLVGFAGLCTPNAQSIANIQSATHDSARIIISFFNGTEEWRSVGTAAEDDPLLKNNGGLDVAARTADDSTLKLASLDASSARGTSKRLNLPSQEVAYTDLFPAGPLTLTAVSGGLTVSNPISLQAGGTQAFTIKPGPWIARVLPAAANVFPLSVAPGSVVAIYGRSLARDTAQADGLPFPLQLSDTQVSVNGSALSLYYVSPAQIDAVIPDMAPGLAKLTVRNSSGAHTVNVLVEPAVPAIFTKDASGSGPAAAIRAVNNRVVSQDNPLHPGETVELFLTGLGSTTRREGLNYANQQPTVTITGQPCEVTFAGRAPGYVGLDQINCVVPAGFRLTVPAPVIVTSGNRSSNVATLAVQ